MINDIEIEKRIEKKNSEEKLKEKNILLNELKDKYYNIIKNNHNDNCIKEINCLNKILENSFSINKFNDYINNEFLENCEYKLVFMPEEFNMKENGKYYFPGIGDKKKKKVNYKNKNGNYKNHHITEAKKKFQ